MKLIVGLGNPGEKYKKTRHNIGYMVLDHLLEDALPVEKTFWDPSFAKASEGKRDKKSLTKKVVIEGQEVFLAKPITYMNLSGEAVSTLIKEYSLKSQELYIIYDDLDLPFGHIKVRFGGGAGGHNGIQSVIDSLGTDSFLRIRVGIGRPNQTNSKLEIRNSKLKTEDYVLEKFGSGEIGELRHVIKEVIKNIKLILKEGIEMYMSKYNKKRLDE